MILYHYTIAVFLCILLACATCFSVYVVTRRDVFLSASIFFLAYFFDVSLVFRTTYAPSRGSPDLFAIHSPVESVLIGALLVFCTWLTFCLYVGKTSYLATLACMIFVVLSAFMYFEVYPSNVREFCFFSVRSLMNILLVICMAVYYLGLKDQLEKARLHQHFPLFLGYAILSVGTVLWNIYFQLLNPHALLSNELLLLPERNPIENILYIFMGFWICRAGMGLLETHFDKPAVSHSAVREAFIKQRIERYASLYDLSPREKEILAMVLNGESNPEIADDLYLSPSTVKVHVHNILKKTDLEDRVALTKDFWKRA